MAFDNCIENKIWLLYSQQKLEKSELDALFLHIENCEICSDIKAGIDGMKNPSSLNSAIENLNKKIDKRISEKSKTVILFRYISTAAIFIAVVGLAWFFYDKTNPEIVIEKLNKNLVPQPENNLVDSSTDYSINNKKKKIIQDNSLYKLNEPIELYDTTGMTKTEEKSLSLNQISVTEDVGGVAPENNDDVQKDEKYERNDKNLNETETVKPSTQSNSDKESKRKKSIAKESAPSNKYYKNAEISESENLTESYDYRFAGDSIHFYNSLKLYNVGKYDTCLILINSKAIESNSPFYEDILYLEAKTLIKLERKSEAKIILQQLINLKGTHYRKAKRLLKTIK